MDIYIYIFKFNMCIIYYPQTKPLILDYALPNVLENPKWSYRQQKWHR